MRKLKLTRRQGTLATALWIVGAVAALWGAASGHAHETGGGMLVEDLRAHPGAVEPGSCLARRHGKRTRQSPYRLYSRVRACVIAAPHESTHYFPLIVPWEGRPRWDRSYRVDGLFDNGSEPHR